MKDFKRCPNGHFYKKDLANCPHCPQGGSQGDDNSGNSDLDKTQVFGGQSGNSDRTEVMGSDGNEKTQVFGGSTSSSNSNSGGANRDLDRTFIGGVTVENDGGSSEQAKPRAARKISGWIVSFTLDPMGIDYRIYEGSNSIGRDSSNSISIVADTTISGEHAVILHRSGKFWIEDAMTSNGTSVNGTELEPRKAYEIKDGDEVKLGDTIFVFKTWY